MRKYIDEKSLLDILSNYETWEFTSESNETYFKNILISPYANEEWVFELKDGTTIKKQVVIQQ